MSTATQQSDSALPEVGSALEFLLSPKPSKEDAAKGHKQQWYWLLTHGEFRTVIRGSHTRFDTEAEARADWAEFVSRVNAAKEPAAAAEVAA